MKNLELAKRIQAFIDKYAVVCPNWSKGDDIDDKYTSPDAYELLTCAQLLEKEKIPTKCFSEWGSGGFKPYNSVEGRKEHDYLVIQIYEIITSKI